MPSLALDGNAVSQDGLNAEEEVVIESVDHRLTDDDNDHEAVDPDRRFVLGRVENVPSCPQL